MLKVPTKLMNEKYTCTMLNIMKDLKITKIGYILYST